MLPKLSPDQILNLWPQYDLKAEFEVLVSSPSYSEAISLIESILIVFYRQEFGPITSNNPVSFIAVDYNPDNF